MKKNLSAKRSKYQAEDAIRLIVTAVIVLVIMAALIRFNAHTFISDKIIASPDQQLQSDEDDTPPEPTPSQQPSEQIE